MIQLLHVSKTYPPNYRALSNIDLEVAEGEFVFVAGPSGAGKSTLLKLLFREEEPSEGQILINGKSVTSLTSRGVARLRQKIGLVFQEFKLLAHLTALENVSLAAEVVGVSKNQSRMKAYQLLRDLGLKDRHDSKPLSLSGGEQQRVAIARALVNDPKLVLADEPTGNLDADVAEETMRLLFKIRERGTTIIVASHDLNMINRYGTRVVLLQRGALADDLRLGSRPERGK
ncbi:MAG TPA: cell division ATP-binding protein FtsE [Candidatus Binatia bacterium]|nr:cell division ATP-binding protein FtsE [Candidatus Binatia bacterium]